MLWTVSFIAVALQILRVNGGDIVKLDENFDMTWSVSSGRMVQPKCIAIPSNMSLCHNIGYQTMRLPNLLEHDNLKEAMTQASNWSPLIGIRCHPDTQVFLCSLFSPVCLERVVRPCRSLCEGVQKACEGYMKSYGFPWPEMFRCDKFPKDDALCIPGPSGSKKKKVDSRVCKPCQGPDTYEGILHNICKAEYVVRATVKGLNHKSTTAAPGEIEVIMGKRKKKFYKRQERGSRKIFKKLADKEAKIYISQGIGCTCGQRIIAGQHHLMGIQMEQKYDIKTGQKIVKFYASFITSWTTKTRSKPGLKKALRAVRKNENVCQGGVYSLNIHKQMQSDDTTRKTKKVKKTRRLRKQKRH